MGRLGLIFLLGVAACASPTLRTVPRVVDGRVEHGSFVSPYAYEWFIEGEMSAVKGQHDEAAMAFEAATAAPANDVVLMTRLAEEYELSGASRRADRTLAVARRSYPESARVALAEGRIQRSRGADREALVVIRTRQRVGADVGCPSRRNCSDARRDRTYAEGEGNPPRVRRDLVGNALRACSACLDRPGTPDGRRGNLGAGPLARFELDPDGARPGGWQAGARGRATGVGSANTRGRVGHTREHRPVGARTSRERGPARGGGFLGKGRQRAAGRSGRACRAAAGDRRGPT